MGIVLIPFHSVGKILGDQDIFREEFLFKRDLFIRTAVEELTDTVQKLPDAFAAYRGNGIYADSLRLEFIFQPFHRVFISENAVDLVGCDNLRPGRDLGIIRLQFLIDLIDIVHRIPAFRGGRVHDVHQNAGTFNMAKELVSKSHSLGGAFDQPGDIGNDKTAVVGIHNAPDSDLM